MTQVALKWSAHSVCGIPRGSPCEVPFISSVAQVARLSLT